MVATLAHKQAVAALPAMPPRYSLLFVASPIQDAERWMAGVEWAPEQKAGGGIASVIGQDCTQGSSTLSRGTNPATATADPFVVYADDHCSTFGWQARDYEARARRQLEAVQSYYVANELLLGTVAQAQNLDNHWLTENPTTVGVPGGQSVVAALADIEMGLAAAFKGRPGMVHVTPAQLTALHAAYAIEMSGQKWMTAMGNTVVADAGYTGARPDADNTSTKQWIYGTSEIKYRLGDVILNPGTLDDARAAMDRATNLITIFAERLVLLQWDVGVIAAETEILAF